MHFRAHGFGNGFLLGFFAFVVLVLGLLTFVGAGLMAWWSDAAQAPFWWRLSGGGAIAVGSALIILNLP